MNVFQLLRRLARRGPRPSSASRARNGGRWPAVELLEDRVVPYSVTGNAWPHPQLITLSFVLDGTHLGGAVTSNLFSTFNGNAYYRNAGPGNWQSVILKAAQAWAQQTNINFALVGDSGAASGSGASQQGDPSMGDIRVGGYAFGNPTLGDAYQPPRANNYSIAGDIVFNTGQAWGGGGYDLFTVAMHEIGHALGMDHGTSSAANVMYPSYNGVKFGLSGDDVAGIKAIYGARAPDAYDAAASNNTLATATNLSSLISTTSLTALATGLDVTTTTDADCYTFTAPAGTSSTMSIRVQSQGLSLLSPKVTVYAANQTTVLGSASGLNQYGTTLTVTVGGVSAGQTYYAQVRGADSTAFSTGAYALALNFGTGATPTATPPNTQIANGTPLSGGGGAADGHADGDKYLNNVPTITTLLPDTGASPSDRITNVPNISLAGTAPVGNTVQVYLNTFNWQTGSYQPQLIGTTVATDNARWTFDYTGTALADGVYQFSADVIDGQGTVSNQSSLFSVTIDTAAPAAPLVTGFSPDSGVQGDGLTNAKAPTVFGLAESFSTVNVYRTNPDGHTQFAGTASANVFGLWSYISQDLGDGTYRFAATAIDLAGNVSPASAPLGITIDTKAPSNPEVKGISPDTSKANDGVTTARNLVISGTAQANVSVTVFQNGLAIGTATADGTGAWQFDDTGTTLADSTYQFAGQAFDVAGNTSNVSGSFKVIVETVGAPVIAGAAETFDDHGVATLTVSGTAPANAHLQLLLNGSPVGTPNADGNGKWSFQYTPASLPAGSYSFTAIATDNTANVSVPSAPLNLVVGGGAPYVSAPSVASGSVIGTSGGNPVTGNTPTFTGTATAGSTVTVVDGNAVLGTAVADVNGNWTFTAPALAKGKYQVAAFDTDAFGNSGLLSAPLTIKV